MFVICNAFTIGGHDFQSSITLTLGHGVTKKCRFNLSLFPHKFSQHGHLYLGWHLPFNNVDCTFNNSLILTTLYAHSFIVYQNKSHVNENIVLPFSFLRTSCHHCNIPFYGSGGINSQGPHAIDNLPHHFMCFRSEFFIRHGFSDRK